MSREEYLLNVIQVLNPVVLQGTLPNIESTSTEKAEFLYESAIMEIYNLLCDEHPTDVETEKESEEDLKYKEEPVDIDELYRKQKLAEQKLMYEEAISLLQKKLNNLD